jgi:hypothetical protein
MSSDAEILRSTFGISRNHDPLATKDRSKRSAFQFRITTQIIERRLGSRLPRWTARRRRARSWARARGLRSPARDRHLDGVLFIDHISKLKRDRVIKKFQKAAKRAGDGSHGL